jgi:hypothetical protein
MKLLQKKSDPTKEAGEIVIRTSSPDWLNRSLELYRDKIAFVFIDDAKIGIDARDLESAVSLIRAARTKGSLDFKRIASVLVGVGLSGAGIWMIAAAIADPEPTSKLGLLITGGIVITLTGGIGTLSALGVKFVITGRGRGGSEFKIEPKE